MRFQVKRTFFISCLQENVAVLGTIFIGDRIEQQLGGVRGGGWGEVP